MNPSLIGFLIALGFAVYWLRVGAAAVGGPDASIIFLGGSVVILGALWRVWAQRNNRIPGARWRLGWYLAALGGEIVSLNVALLTLPKDFLATYQAPVIGTIVGLHFAGVWLATNMRRFIYLCAVMTAINLAAFLLPTGNGPAMVAGFGSAAALIGAVVA